VHHFKNNNNRYHIKLCSNKGKILSHYTFPNLSLEQAKNEARFIWATVFVLHKKWLEIANQEGQIVFKHDNLK
jgi:hypothetical protein